MDTSNSVWVSTRRINNAVATVPTTPSDHDQTDLSKAFAEKKWEDFNIENVDKIHEYVFCQDGIIIAVIKQLDTPYTLSTLKLLFLRRNPADGTLATDSDPLMLPVLKNTVHSSFYYNAGNDSLVILGTSMNADKKYMGYMVSLGIKDMVIHRKDRYTLGKIFNDFGDHTQTDMDLENGVAFLKFGAEAVSFNLNTFEIMNADTTSPRVAYKGFTQNQMIFVSRQTSKDSPLISSELEVHILCKNTGNMERAVRLPWSYGRQANCMVLNEEELLVHSTADDMSKMCLQIWNIASHDPKLARSFEIESDIYPLHYLPRKRLLVCTDSVGLHGCWDLNGNKVSAFQRGDNLVRFFAYKAYEFVTEGEEVIIRVAYDKKHGRVMRIYAYEIDTGRLLVDIDAGEGVKGYHVDQRNGDIILGYQDGRITVLSNKD